MTTPADINPDPPDRDDDERSALGEWLSNFLTRMRIKNVAQVRRIMISVVGGTVLLIGVLLIVLPGPAVLVIPAGLAILATEYAWARRWLKKARSLANQATGRKPTPERTPEPAGARSD